MFGPIKWRRLTTYSFILTQACPPCFAPSPAGALNQWPQAPIRSPEHHPLRRGRLRDPHPLQRHHPARQSHRPVQLESLGHGDSPGRRHHPRPPPLHGDHAFRSRLRREAPRELVCAEAAQGVEAWAEGLGVSRRGARSGAVESRHVVLEHDGARRRGRSGGGAADARRRSRGANGRELRQ